MELEFNFESDRIKDYLRSKLEEVRLINVNYEKSLQHRREVTSKLSEELRKDFGENSFEIGETWRRTVNNKYVLGFAITNNSGGSLQHLNVILNWNTPSPLNYKFYLISPHSEQLDLLVDGLTYSDCLNKAGHVLVVMDVPPFMDQLTHNITGLITFQQNQRKMMLNTPGITLKSDDITDNLIAIQIYKAIEGSFEDFVSLALSSQKSEFVLMLPNNWNRDLNTTIETYCSLRRIGIEWKKFYLAHNICPAFDGSVVEIGEELETFAVQLDIYSRSCDSLVAFVHYLHRQIVNVSIVPKSAYRRSNTEGLAQQLRDSVLKEVECVRNFLGSSVNRDYAKMRGTLAELEHNTDLLLLDINALPKSEEEKSNSADY